MTIEIAERIELCKSCPELNSLKFCRQCGCYMPVKVRLKWASCPLDKWLPATADFLNNPAMPYTGPKPHEEYFGIKDQE